MTAADLVAHIRALDIRLTVDGDGLRCSAPRGALSDALRAELGLRKAELVAWLRAAGENPDAVTVESGVDSLSLVTSHPGSEEDFPLSFSQERLWFLDQLQPGSTAYSIAARRKLRGPLDVAALKLALRDLVQRHESLRTIFPDSDGAPVQRIGPPELVSLEIADLEHEPAATRAAAAWQLVREHAGRPFDLASGPLFRPVLIRLGPDDHELCIVVHHIVADGWSLGILVRDLTALYAARLTGHSSSLPALPIRYVDFALWQRYRLSGEVLDAHRQYWRARLANLPGPLQLLSDRPRSGPSGSAAASHDFAMPRPLADGLRALGRRENATLFMTMLAVFTVLLARSSGQDDIVVGTPVTNRSHVELEPIIGLFVNTLVLRSDVADDPSFQDLLARVRQTCLDAHTHADMPFEKLVEELQPERVLGLNPMFQVSFVVQDAIEGGDVAFATVATPFDLTLFVRDRADGALSATLEYRRDLFEPAAMTRLAGHYCTLLESVVAEPTRRISDLRMMSDAETHQLLVEWNATATHYPRDRSVHGLFEDQVDAAPDAVALVVEGPALTYRELDVRANRLARHIRAAGVGAGHRVGVLMDRSMEMIVALLAILKAGGAYVPLDRLAPAERLAFMLADTEIGVLLTETRMLSRLPASAVGVIPVDAEWDAVAARPSTRLESTAGGDDLAYVTYTSGSTGAPKGVAVTHRNVVRLVRGTSYARFGPEEVVLQLTALSFDVSTFEIWGALLNGGRLVMAPPDVPSVDELGGLLARHGVTTLWLSAGHFEQVVDHRVEILRPLRQLLAGGDVVSPPHVRRVLSAFPTLSVINGYGPTEGTTFACCHTITSAPPPGRSVPIGRPIANTRVYVLDRHRRPVPVGVPGELWIAGDGVARGYVERPEITAERFVVQALSPTLQERLYRTSDLVRWLDDGTIEFIGRLDDQVKIRGFRVELGEIEATLTRHPRVQSAVVVARRRPGGEASLVGYVVSAEPLDPRELREFLQRTLPPYMIPPAFVRLDRLPLSVSGKVDRRVLPEPPTELPAPVEPRDGLERQLAKIWRDVLSIDRVGIRDNFFDLGGHSLLAMRMVARTENALGIVLSLATLFEAPTIEDLAAVIRRGLRPASGRSLVAIHATGSRVPLFVIPGVTGTVLGYHRLARLLGSDQPLYGLQSRGLDGIEPPLTRIEDIASAYLPEIREIQPSGPYHLIGMCMGGVVAYEIAQQLHAAGEKVGFLGLLETWPPEVASALPLPRAIRASALLGILTGRLRLHVETLRRVPGLERLRFLGRGLRDVLRDARAEVFLHAVTQANRLAFRRYVPRAYPGSVVLVCAEGRPLAPSADLRMVWAGLALGGHEVYSAPGDDSGLMLTEPHVRTLATQLTACLSRAQASSRPG